ncbi:hypothetical protein CXB51_019440 [Gossypium anomalum]|uniref:Uncharacterized protein n=1 Tax=Gossypium anomalum TaxID=47600 RepID=A0A8J5YA92_9ROSI|nr:hypothetical protein CXB51_019440 [Gossypium anomalum]
MEFIRLNQFTRRTRVNLVKTNNLNGHIGSSLPEDGLYIAKPIYLECRVNSVQEKTLNGSVGSSLQDELLRSQANEFQSIGNSESQHYNFIQPISSTLSSGRYNFQDLNDYHDHQIDQFNLMTTQLGSQVSKSMLQDSPMHSGSYWLPRHQQASNQFSIPGLSKLPHHQQASTQFLMPCLSNPDLYNSKLHKSSILQRLQQQEGLLNQQARDIPTYPLFRTRTATGIRTSISSIVFNSLLQNETGDTSNSHQVKKYRKREPSTLPMQHRDPSTMLMPMPIPVTNAEHENRNLLSMHNETNTSSNASNLSSPRPIKNSLYDPSFERIGLPVDPHLRMFGTM